MSKPQYIKNYEPETRKVKNWFHKLCQELPPEYKVKVACNVQDSVDIDENSLKVIRLRKRVNEEKMIHIFLHEIGHLIVAKRKDYKTKFKNMIEAAGARRYNRNAYRIGVLEEEILAWEEGFKLAKSLRMKLDYEAFDKTKNESIKTYARMAARK